MGRSGRKGRVLRTLVAAVGGVGVLFLAASFYVEFRWAHRIRGSSSEVPAAPVALIFGAGLAPGGVPSKVLAQRLDRGVALYREGKVQKLLVSGDNTDRYHHETSAMRRYLVRNGVPAEDVIGDDAGVSTYDSVWRARNVFGVDRAVLVTQEFHLPRALFIANALGMDAWGVPATPNAPRVWNYEVRELFSRALAFGMVVARVEPRERSGGAGAAGVGSRSPGP